MWRIGTTRTRANIAATITARITMKISVLRMARLGHCCKHGSTTGGPLSCENAGTTMPCGPILRNNVPDKPFLDHGAGAMCVGEPHEAITHYSVDCGVDDCCRSVAHNSR